MPLKRDEDGEYSSNQGNARGSDNLQALADPTVQGSSMNISVPEPVPISPQIPEPDLIVSPEVHESEPIAYPRVPEPVEEFLEPEPVEDHGVPEPVEDHEMLSEPDEETQVPVREDERLLFGANSEVRGSIAESYLNLERLEPPYSLDLYRTLGAQIPYYTWFPSDIPYGCSWHCRPVPIFQQMAPLQDFWCRSFSGPRRFRPALTALIQHIRFVCEVFQGNAFTSGIEYPEAIIRQCRFYPLDDPDFFHRLQGGEDEPQMMLINEYMNLPHDRGSVEEHPTANLSRNSNMQVIYTYPRGGSRLLLNVVSMTRGQYHFMNLNQQMCNLFDLVEFLTTELAVDTISTNFRPYVERLPPTVYSEMVERGDARVGTARRLMDDLRNIYRDCLFILHSNRYILAYVHSYAEWIRQMYARYIFTGRHIMTVNIYQDIYEMLFTHLRRAFHNIICYTSFVIAFSTIKRELMEIFRPADREPIVNPQEPEPVEDPQEPEPVEDPLVLEPVEDPRVPRPRLWLNNAVEFLESILARLSPFIPDHTPFIEGPRNHLADCVVNILQLRRPSNDHNLFMDLFIHGINLLLYFPDYLLHGNTHPSWMIFGNPILNVGLDRHRFLLIMDRHVRRMRSERNEIGIGIRRGMEYLQRAMWNWGPPSVRQDPPTYPYVVIDDYPLPYSADNLQHFRSPVRRPDDQGIFVPYVYPNGHRMFVPLNTITFRHFDFLVRNVRLCELYDEVEYLTDSWARRSIEGRFQEFIQSLPPPILYEMTWRNAEELNIVCSYINDIAEIYLCCHWIIYGNRLILAYVASFARQITNLYVQYVFQGRDFEGADVYDDLFQLIEDNLNHARHNIDRYPSFAMAFNINRRVLNETFRAYTHSIGLR